VLRRRRVPVFVLLSFCLVVVAATALTLGQTRIRAPAEVPIVILAAIGIDAAVQRFARSSRRASAGGARMLRRPARALAPSSTTPAHEEDESASVTMKS